MNSVERLSFLIRYYSEGKCSRLEFDELFSLIEADHNQDQIFTGLKELWDNTSSDLFVDEERWEHLYHMHMTHTGQHELVRPVHKSRVGLRIAVAAAVLFFLSVVMFFYVYRPVRKTDMAHQQMNRFLPGTNKAILTLASGEKMVLDDKANGELISQAGVKVTKTGGGQLIYQITGLNKNTGADRLVFNTIETPKGGQYQVLMPDGTKIWLNAMSVLKYPVRFSAQERRVELKGEAYFEVAKNKAVPFKVNSGRQEVEVLGTHFNINSYADEDKIKTTLLEGSVKVSSTGGKAVRLVPGQECDFDLQDLQVHDVDTELAIAWKNGYFMFNKADMESIMRQVSRWYNVEIVFQNEKVKRKIFSGSVSRFEDASQLLDILELTKLVHFKIEGRRIIVMQ